MNKFCPQFQTLPSWAAGVVREALPPWALLIEPPAGNSPFTAETKVLARAWIGGDDVEYQYTMAGAEGAKAYYDLLRPFYDARRYVHVWQGPNEPFVGETTFWRALVDFTLELDMLMRKDGRLLAGGAFSVGWPLLDPKYLVDLLPMYQTCAYMLHHEYSAPTMMDRSAPTEPDGGMWHCLRYRRVYAYLESMSTISLAPLLIGETGIDGGVAPVYRAKTGWKDYCVDGFPEYLEQLRWYGEEVARDEYVKAVFPFVCASNREWDRFDINEPQMMDILSMAIGDPVALPLPGDETATDAGTLCEKARWWLEEMQRAYERGDLVRANDIRLSLIDLMYRAENAAKAAGC